MLRTGAAHVDRGRQLLCASTAIHRERVRAAVTSSLGERDPHEGARSSTDGRAVRSGPTTRARPGCVGAASAKRAVAGRVELDLAQPWRGSAACTAKTTRRRRGEPSCAAHLTSQPATPSPRRRLALCTASDRLPRHMAQHLPLVGLALLALLALLIGPRPAIGVSPRSHPARRGVTTLLDATGASSPAERASRAAGPASRELVEVGG